MLEIIVMLIEKKSHITIVRHLKSLCVRENSINTIYILKYICSLNVTHLIAEKSDIPYNCKGSLALKKFVIILHICNGTKSH